METARAEVVRWAGRFAARARAIVVCLLALLAPLGLDSGPSELAVAIGLAVVMWQLAYFWACARFQLSCVVVADAVVLAGVCCSASLTINTSKVLIGNNWLVALVGFSIVAYQWQVGPLAGAVAAVLGCAGFLVGSFFAVPGQVLEFMPEVLWFLVQALLAGGLLAVIRGGAELADDAAARESAERVRVAVSSARRAAERKHLAVLHDTAAATLLMVGSGVIARSERWLRRQAGRDLRALGEASIGDNQILDLVPALAEVAADAPVRVRLIGLTELQIPAAHVLAVCGAVGEALCNVSKHARSAHAIVAIGGDGPDGLWVEVRDTGCGFEPSRVDGLGRGLTHSIGHRLRDVGGRTALRSAPGVGTSVTLWLPPRNATPSVAVQPERVERLARALPRLLLPRLRWAVLGIGVTALVAFYLPVMLTRPETYRPPWLMITALALLAVGIAATVLVLRRRIFIRWRWPLLAVVLLAAHLGATSIPGPDLLGAADWTYLVPGLLIVALLVDRPFNQLCAALLANSLVAFCRALLLGPGDLVSFIGLACILVNAFGLLLAVAVGVRGLSKLGDRADGAIAARERVRLGQMVSAHVHQDRQQRYADLSRTVAPLLDGLANGTLSPDQQSVRQDCAVEAARMRRLFAESDDVVDPLTHELRACADNAGRRGVAVYVMTGGRRIEVPKMTRRALTEPVLALLTVTTSRAKITVTEHDDTVIVSAAGDVAGDTALPLSLQQSVPAKQSDLHASGRSVNTELVRSDRAAWITASWTLVRRPKETSMSSEQAGQPR